MSKRTKPVIAGALLLLCGLVAALLWPRQTPRPIDFLVEGPPVVTNGVLAVKVVLSNSTPRTVNVVDDRSGAPHFIIETGSRTPGIGLGRIGNTLKLNLSPGAALTNIVRITNAPPRFRLRVRIRDLAVERWNFLTQLVTSLTARLTRSDANQATPDWLLPVTLWIETQAEKE